MSALTEVELAAIADFLVERGLPLAGPLSSTSIAAGRSNLTFKLDDGARQWVLRMPPRVGRTPSAHDVAREFRVTHALAGTDVPVPPAAALCEDESVIGSAFAVAEFVEGRSIQSRSDLDTIDDATLEELTDRLIEVLAALHAVDHLAVGLERFGRPDGYAERQIRRWTQQWDLVAGESTHASRGAAQLSAGLARRIPEQRATSIVHGDFRIDNTLLRLEGKPAVSAVVDWELSTIGDPAADVAMMCAYRHPAFDLIVGEQSAWTSPRLPGADELAAAYETAGGIALTDWEFHLALAHFKVAVIAAGINHRHEAGASTSAGFESAGEAVAPYLAAGLQFLATSA
jgi:aminoglycoside phosphotransferase (APT) family kinase protein